MPASRTERGNHQGEGAGTTAEAQTGKRDDEFQTAAAARPKYHASSSQEV
jgi:hypothetical protein